MTPYGAQRLDASDAVGDAELVKMTTELVLWRLAATTGGVVLGRASTLVLAEYPNVFRVRLDGPVEARIAWAMTYGHLDEEAARRAQRADRSRPRRLRSPPLRHFHDRPLTFSTSM